MMKAQISDLYPREAKVYRTKVNSYKEEYSGANPQVRPPTIAVIDGCYLVRDGHHRIVAAHQLGMTEIDVVDDTPITPQELRILRSELESSISNLPSKFDSVELVDSSAERMKSY